MDEEPLPPCEGEGHPAPHTIRPLPWRHGTRELLPAAAGPEDGKGVCRGGKKGQVRRERAGEEEKEARREGEGGIRTLRAHGCLEGSGQGGAKRAEVRRCCPGEIL